MSALFALLALGLSSWALEANDRLVLRLGGEVEVEGWFYEVSGDVLVLSGATRMIEVQLPMVLSVAVNGEPTALDAFLAEAEEARLRREEELANPPPLPHPVIVAGAGMLWGGGGYAVMGDFRPLLVYSVIDVVLFGAAAWQVQQAGSLSPAVPLVGVDLAIRAYGASDAARLARARRQRFGGAQGGS